MSAGITAGELITATFEIPIEVITQGYEATVGVLTPLGPFGYLVGLGTMLLAMYVLTQYLYEEETTESILPGWQR